MREKPSSFECNGEPKTCDLNTELVATTNLGSDMCYALSFGCIDDAGIEEVLEMHLKAVSAVSRSISYSTTIKEPPRRLLVGRILKSNLRAYHSYCVYSLKLLA
jgi:hypothetical protein